MQPSLRNDRGLLCLRSDTLHLPANERGYGNYRILRIIRGSEPARFSRRALTVISGVTSKIRPGRARYTPPQPGATPGSSREFTECHVVTGPVCPSAPLYNSIKRKLGNFPGDSSLSVTFCFARSHTRNSTYVRWDRHTTTTTTATPRKPAARRLSLSLSARDTAPNKYRARAAILTFATRCAPFRGSFWERSRTARI